MAMDDTVTDWDWIRQFHMAGYLDAGFEKQQENKMYQIKQSTPTASKDTTRLNYLGKYMIKGSDDNTNSLQDKDRAESELASEAADKQVIHRKLKQMRAPPDYLSQMVSKRQKL